MQSVPVRPWRFSWRGTVAVAAAVLWAAGGSAAQDRRVDDVAAAVSGAGKYVERYFTAARTVTARETVVLQPLDDRLRNRGPARTILHDVRVEWSSEPGAVVPPRVHRHPALGSGEPDDRATECLAPESADPLAFLLPGARGAYAFGPMRGEGGGGALIAIEYAPLEPGPPSLTWRGDCGTFDLPGRARGRVLVEPATFAVRRLESRLVRPVEIPVPEQARRPGWGDTITAERVDVTVAYEPVTFRDPEETLLLPAETVRLTVVRTPDRRALRVTQRFSGFQRFVTASRVVPR